MLQRRIVIRFFSLCEGFKIWVQRYEYYMTWQNYIDSYLVLQWCVERKSTLWRYWNCKIYKEMEIFDLNTLIGLLTGGGVVGIFTIPSAIKKAKAEAKEPEIEAWKKLVDELQEQNHDLRERVTVNESRIDELNKRIDDLYKTNGEWREENNNLKAENSQLKAENEHLKAEMDKLKGKN